MNEPVLNPVRDRFERDARSFDAIYRLERSAFSRWFNTTFRKAVFERYDITFQQVGSVAGKSVLDIGCGSGIYSVDFARRGARRVLGVDFSGNMLELARQEAAKHDANACEFLQANFQELEVAEPFDIAIAIGVFDYLPDPQTFLNKMSAVTTEMVIASFPGHSIVRERARKLRYAITGKGSVYFYTDAEVRKLAEGAGFRSYELIPIRTSGTGFVLVARH